MLVGIRARYVLPLSVFAIALAPALFASPGEKCVRCHPQEVAGYAATQMAHSLSSPWSVPSGSFVHAASGTHFTTEVKGSQILQKIERNGFSAQYVPQYAIGSGTHAVGYLIDIRNHLFQAPICYYRGRGWGIAPGYENYKAPDFYRPVTAECLFCHSGEARPVSGTLNTYRDPPFDAEGITCERCHGPSESHLRNPVPGSIINPAKLPIRARDSVCEECHLAGVVRIPNPGKQITDFRPGEDLENVYTVYLERSSQDAAHPGALDVISQSQQLALSKCARMSGGKLWCGTCHDPHVKPVNAVAYFRARCLSCHGVALLKTHPQPNENCIGCHMPRLPVVNGGHTIFTDHRIAIYTPQELAAQRAAAKRDHEDRGTPTLVPWHNPPAAFAQRNLGLADIELGDRLKSFDLVDQGFKLLLQNWSRFPRDPLLLTEIGNVILGEKDFKDAEGVLKRVVQIEPDAASPYAHLGLAWKQAGEDTQAIATLRKSLQLDPLQTQPYRELVEIYAAENQPAKVLATYEQFVQAFPKSLEAQAGLVRARRVLSPSSRGLALKPVH
jgi:Cytochrome c554 and c-prime